MLFCALWKLEIVLYSRYDGRGHLHDLSEYDADCCRGSTEPLTEDEKQIERLCDEERYLELNTDVLEKMLYEGTCCHGSVFAY